MEGVESEKKMCHQQTFNLKSQDHVCQLLSLLSSRGVDYIACTRSGCLCLILARTRSESKSHVDFTP